jgi:hypothetical protein
MATISTRISIEGGDDIRKQLEALAKAAASAFAQIGDAIGKIELDPKTEQAFADLAAAGSKLAQQFSGVAEAAGDTAPAIEETGKAAATAAEGFAKLGDEGSKAAEGIKAVGGSAENTSTSYAGLALNVVRTGAAAGSAAAGIASAGTATATLGVQTVTAAASVGTLALGLGSTLVAAIGVAVGALGVFGAALERIAFDNARLSNTLDHLALTTRDIGQSFASLQVGQAAFQQIGISAEKFRSVMANLAKDMESFKPSEVIAASTKQITDTTRQLLIAEKALLEAQIAREAQSIEAARAPFGAAQRILEINEQLKASTAGLAEAEQAAATAREARAKATANDLTKIVELIQQIEAGSKTITFDPLVKAETIIDAVKTRLNDVVKAGGDVGKTLLNIIANLPKAEAFKVGAAFGLSETDIDRVRRYGAEVTKIDNLNQKIRAAGPLISPESAAGNERMIESTQRLNSAWERLKQAWSSTIFSDLAASATTTFNNMAASVVEFAAQASEAFNMFGAQLFTTLGQIASGWGTIFSMIGQGWGTIFSMIGSGLASLGQSIATFVTTATGGAWQWIADTFTSAVAGLGPLMAQGKSLVDAFVLTPTAGAWAWIVDTWNAMLRKLGIGGGSGGGGAAAPAPSGAGLAGGGLLRGRGTGTSDSNLAWVSRGEYIIPARVVRQPGVLALLEALRLQRFADGGMVGGGQAGAEKIVSVLAGVRQLIDGVQQTLGRLTSTINDGIGGVIKQLERLVNQFLEVINGLIGNELKKASDTLFDLEGALKGHARGGLLGGRGTGTSDSNLAWVSRGEYVVPARAVQRPGVLALLEALRRTGGGNLRDVLDNMGRFALGGMVRAPISIPAFTGGGMSNVTIQFPGLPEITGLRASSAVVDELRKAAALAQIRSGGRKPSRYS